PYEFHSIDERLVYCKTLPDANLLIFASKHSSAAGVPSLSVHATGNWNTAEIGGNEHELAIAPALYLAEALVKIEELTKKQNIPIDVVQECTHHGPTENKQIMFIEIGSTEKEWKTQEYGKIIAETIQHIMAHKPRQRKVAIGIGGTHYCQNFKKLILNENYAFGHICPKYQLEFFTKEMLQQAIEKTTPTVEEIVVDWKGVGSYKEKIKQIIETMDIPMRKI
ncbi:MAG: D-aminoacyl-tRNA deacylase, partial [Candidatus Woesearchaeota archaeon]